MAQDVVVGQMQDIEPVIREPSIATPIANSSRVMIGTIHFYDELCLDAEEIQKVGTLRMLSSELVAERPLSKKLPQDLLCGCARSAELSGSECGGPQNF